MQPPRRVVTGLDSNGRSCVLIDGPSERVIWSTDSFPADNSGVEDAGGGGFAFPDQGTLFRYYDFPPGYRIGLHASDTIDYAVVLAGEIVLATETSETVLRAGDVIVDRGTLHAWRNESDGDCRVMFVLAPARALGGGASNGLMELVDQARGAAGVPDSSNLS